mmetsp:Transcript_47181/g.147619  ORF Transcript_47181/g.147619 Transcript_47181/m.147619 type:complete len:81 (-) Transcript_47181:691-933(-)
MYLMFNSYIKVFQCILLGNKSKTHLHQRKTNEANEQEAELRRTASASLLKCSSLPYDFLAKFLYPFIAEVLVGCKKFLIA